MELWSPGSWQRSLTFPDLSSVTVSVSALLLQHFFTVHKLGLFPNSTFLHAIKVRSLLALSFKVWRGRGQNSHKCMTLPFHNGKCFELNIEMQNEDSRKRKTAELNSVLAKERWVPKTGDNTHADAKQRMLQKAGGFYQSPTLFCGNCKSSDASSSRFVLRLEGSQIIHNNLGFLFPESGLHGRLCYSWRNTRITSKVQFVLGQGWWGTKTFTLVCYGKCHRIRKKDLSTQIMYWILRKWICMRLFQKGGQILLLSFSFNYFTSWTVI